jgi:hypothetical protein
MVLLGGLTLRLNSSFESVVRGFVFAGLVNLVYLVWVNLFGDPIGWNNTYRNILGTLGNPNFIGAFLGMFLASYISFVLAYQSSKLLRISLLIVPALTVFEIIKSHAIQGRVVGAFGIAILGFYLIRSKYGAGSQLAYSAFCSVFGVFALLGALQKGPFSEFIYKTSVSLRGQYWLAGWEMGKNHLWTGVGMDAVGDWYRRTRSPHALELPGVNVVVNASHNVPIDIFAYGGIPLISAYLLLVGLTLLAILKVTLRTKSFNPIFTCLVIIWSGYQLQSIISINQIGLAVWGWLSSGALIAYERTSRIPNNSDLGSNAKRKDRKMKSDIQSKLVLLSFAGTIIGATVSAPPLIADSKWRDANNKRSVQLLEDSFNSSFFNPQNSYKYMVSIQDLEASGLFDLAHKYALQGVAWNSESFELWKVLYLLKASTPNEKSLALENMKRLDPLNPDVTAIQ